MVSAIQLFKAGQVLGSRAACCGLACARSQSLTRARALDAAIKVRYHVGLADKSSYKSISARNAMLFI
jgi:hypothetical protein